MMRNILKWFAAAAALAAIMSWHLPAGERLLIDCLFGLGVLTVAWHALRNREYVWASAFVAGALLLNPAIPVLVPASNLLLAICLVLIAPLALAIASLATNPLFGIREPLGSAGAVR
jgi:hypothetical protein